jgi:hypothetical protein
MLGRTAGPAGEIAYATSDPEPREQPVDRERPEPPKTSVAKHARYKRSVS